jgi:autotransporter translocation and assembly factor TamB
VRHSELELNRISYPRLQTKIELDATQRNDSLGIEWVQLSTSAIQAHPWLQSYTVPELSWDALSTQIQGWIPLDAPEQARVRIEMQAQGLSYENVKSTYAETRIKFDGEADVEQFKLELRGALVEANGRFNMNFEQPEYSFRAALRKLNLARFEGLQDLKTNLNLDLSLQGKGFDTQQRVLTANLNVLPSTINNTPLSRLQADLSLRGQILKVDRADLQSQILDARFDGDVHIVDRFYPSNKLSFTLNLKNLQPLAGFLGYERLSAQGEIRGRLIQGSRSPEIHTVFDLQGLAFDALEADTIRGEYAMELDSDAQFGAQLDVIGIQQDQFRLQELEIESEGRVSEQEIAGDLFLNINAGDTLFSSLEGAFTAQNTSFQMETKALLLDGFFGQIQLQSPFKLSYSDDILRTDTLSLLSDRGDQLQLKVNHFDADRLDLQMQTDAFQLAHVLEYIPNVPDVDGLLKGRLDLDYSKGNLDLDTDLFLMDARYDSLTLDTLTLRTRIEDQRWTGSLLAQHQAQSLIQASWEVPFQLGDPNTFEEAFFMQPVQGNFRIDSLRLAPLLELTDRLGLPQTGGTLQLSAELGGTAGLPLFSGGLDLKNAALAGVPIETFGLKWVYDQDRKTLETRASLRATGQQVGTARVAIPMNIDLRNFRAIIPDSTDAIEGEAIAEGFNLALLNPLLPTKAIQRLQGMIHGGVSMEGTVGDPSFAGYLALEQGSLVVPEYNLNLKQMHAEIRFDDDRLFLDRGIIRSGSGELKLDGSLDLQGFSPAELELKLGAKQFTVTDTRDLKAALSGQAIIKGTVSRPVMTGSVVVDRMNVYLDDFGERTVEQIILDEPTDFNPGSFYDSLAIQMRVQVSPNSWIRNRNSPELALELEGDLELSKQVNEDVQAFGSLNTRQGYALQYGKRFKLEKGLLSFSGNPENPNLDIVTLYELRVPEDIEIRYEIGGSLKKPSFNFSSDPEMELENIISYTLFGKPFGALFSWQQTFSGGGGGSAIARDAAIGVLVDRVETLATGRLGIDLLQIDTNRQGESVSTSIKAGKYITDKLFLQVMNEIGGSDAVTRVVLEYFIRRNLLLVLTQGNDRRSGVDILWKYEY